MSYKDPENVDPNASKEPVTPVAPVEPVAPVAPQPSVYNDLATKKGFKSQDDFAKNYQELEQDRSRKDNAFNAAKQNVEQQSNGSLTLDEKGSVVSTGQQAQPQGQPYGQQNQPYGQPQEVWDEHQGKYVTDPTEAYFARNNIPIYQRQAMIAQAVISQNENLQRQAFQSDSEVLSRPEAKGFEDDVRKYMQAQPANIRANKQSWEMALKIVKGSRFDELSKTMGQEAVDKFLNKASVQSIPAAGGGGTPSGAKLTDDQERTYQWYVANQPSMFKDRKEFTDSLSRGR